MEITKGPSGLVAACGIVAGAAGALRDDSRSARRLKAPHAARSSRGHRRRRLAKAAGDARLSPDGDHRGARRRRGPPRAGGAPGAAHRRASASSPRRAPVAARRAVAAVRRGRRRRSCPRRHRAAAGASRSARRRVEQPRYEDLVLPAQSVIGIQVETDRVERDGAGRRRGDRPRDARRARRRPGGDPGGRARPGVVTLVERGGRLKERARLGVRFTSVVAGRRHARADRHRGDLPRG